MSEITKTQAELDAFTSSQTKNWVRIMCFILFLLFTGINISLLLLKKFDLLNAGISFGVLAVIYFVTTANTGKSRSGNRWKLVAWALLWFGIFQAILVFLILRFATLFNIWSAGELVSFIFWIVAFFAWIIPTVKWIINLIESKPPGALYQLEINGVWTECGANLVPSVTSGVFRMLPFKNGWPVVKIHSVPNLRKQLDHKEIKKAIGAVDKEDGIVFNVLGIFEKIVKGIFPYRVCDTLAYLKADKAEQQLPEIIFQVLQKVLNETATDESDPLVKIESTSKVTLQRILKLLNEGAASVGCRFEPCSISIEKPEKVMRALVEGKAELIKTGNNAKAVEILIASGMTRTHAEITASAILRDIEVGVENRNINVSEEKGSRQGGSAVNSAVIAGLYGNVHEELDGGGVGHEHHH